MRELTGWLGSSWPSNMGALPDFLIIGAQKAGTTYLQRNLLQHPLIHGSFEQEVRFFSVGRGQGGRRAYRKHFPPRRDLPRGALVGDKSPDYLYTPQAPQKAARATPNARVIALLRNPVDRTYSQYQHVRLKLGRESLDFEDALEAEPERVAPMYDYLRWSRYIEHLPQWYERFEVLVIKSEDMYADPRPVLKQACGFLGVPYQDEGFVLEGRRDKRDRHTGNYTEPMPTATRQWLEEYFEPYNQRLYEYLGRDFGW